MTNATDLNNILFNYARRIHRPLGIEKSCKLSQSRVAASRYLLSFTKDSLGFRPHQRLCKLMEQCHCPAELTDLIPKMLKDSVFVHIGVENNKEDSLIKLYFEQSPELITRKSQLQHIAFKWLINTPNQYNISRYYIEHESTDELPAEKLLQLLQSLFPQKRNNVFMNHIWQFIQIIYQHNNQPITQVLRVVDDNSNRDSMDINLYSADIYVANVSYTINQLAKYMKCQNNDLDTVLNKNADTRLGHISLGIDRNEHDFFTFYYNAKTFDGHGL